MTKIQPAGIWTKSGGARSIEGTCTVGTPTRPLSPLGQDLAILRVINPKAKLHMYMLVSMNVLKAQGASTMIFLLKYPKYEVPTRVKSIILLEIN